MLHIILGILKIIGILVGIIFLLLLAALLAAVFVPVRYKLSAKAQAGQYAVSLRGSWLLHMVSAAVTADSAGESGIEVAIRLFGIRLPLFGSDKKSGKKHKEKDRKEDAEKGRKPSGDKAVKRDEPEHEQKLEPSKPERKPKRRSESEQSSKLSKQERKTGQNESKAAKMDQKADRPNILQKIWFQCRRICDKIKQIIQKIVALLRKPGELLALAEEYEARELLGTLVGHLVFLIAHYKPRRIRGYVRFGTDDPSVTGQLTGLIYFLLPARADRFSVCPEFNEKVFETETVCSGHIRALHVLRVLWRCFRDKRLRRAISAYRGPRG